MLESWLEILQKIDKRSFVTALVKSVGIAIIFGITIYFKIEGEDRNSLCEFMTNTLLNFGITFSAFTITAFSLIQFLKEKSWFVAAKKETPIADRISYGFQLAIGLSLLSIFIAIFSKIAALIGIETWIIFPTLDLFLISLCIFWVWHCTKLLLELFSID